MTVDAPPIEARGLVKRYGHITAVDDVDLTLHTGEILGIIGPNGAGKTTMMDVITGKTRPDAGRAFFGSTIDLLRLRENAIAQVGIGRKFQKPTVYEQLTSFTATMLPDQREAWRSSIRAFSTRGTSACGEVSTGVAVTVMR